MALMDGIQAFLDRWISPLSDKIAGSNAIRGLSAGVMATIPITVGVCGISIISSLPIPVLQDFLTSTGLGTMASEAVTMTMNLSAPFMVAAIAYQYATLRDCESSITAAIAVLGTFLSLVPLTHDDAGTNLINVTYLGSSGIFIAIVMGILATKYYLFLLKYLKIELPSTVPPMVAHSISPVIVGIVLFTTFFFIKYGFSLTPWGNIFDFVNQTVAIPVMALGANPFAYIIIQVFSSFLWFFGIHASAVMNVYIPVMTMVSIQNAEAYIANDPLPYATLGFLFAIAGQGGTGETIGLNFSTLFARSERFRSLRKVSFVPGLFQVSEPMIFGMPVVYNPIFLVPMVLAPLLSLSGAWALCDIFGLVNNMNPLINLPFAVPKVVFGFMRAGFGGLIVTLAAAVIAFAVWFPFFRVADKRALDEEHEAALTTQEE